MSGSHARQPTPSSAPEVKAPDCPLTIRELARRAGVSTSAIRYYEELGLLPEPAWRSGQRRYPESTVRLIGVILLLSDAGFTLAEQKVVAGSPLRASGDWGRLARRKLDELDEKIARAAAAREAIAHGLRCPQEDVTGCSTFEAGVTARLSGRPLARFHQELHAPP